MLLDTLQRSGQPSPSPPPHGRERLAPNVTGALGNQPRMGRHHHSSSQSPRQTTMTSQRTRLPEVPPDLEKLNAALCPEQKANVKLGGARR